MWIYKSSKSKARLKTYSLLFPKGIQVKLKHPLTGIGQPLNRWLLSSNKRSWRKLASFSFSVLHLVSGTQTLNKEKPLSEEKKSATLRSADSTMDDFAQKVIIILLENKMICPTSRKGQNSALSFPYFILLKSN